MAMPKKITSWSFSRYSVYMECPLKARLKFIDKVLEPGSDAMARGNRIHKDAENYIKGAGMVVPADLTKFSDMLKHLRKAFKNRPISDQSSIVVEDSWAFTKEWAQTVYNDWANCACRIKVDCAHRSTVVVDSKKLTVLFITDWKTGKFRPEKNEEYIEQLELYALAALLLYPDVDIVEPQLAYTDQGIMYPPDDAEPIRFTLADLPRLKKIWEKRVKPMLNDTRFAPKPNSRCTYCHYRKSNAGNGGGQCQF